jgi:hypothetical protein
MTDRGTRRRIVHWLDLNNFWGAFRKLHKGIHGSGHWTCRVDLKGRQLDPVTINRVWT